MAKKKEKKTGIVVHLPKNIGAIHMSNEMTLVERKIINIILWNATLIERQRMNQYQDIKQEVEQKEDLGTILIDDRKFYKIKMEDVEEKLGWTGQYNRDDIIKAFRGLVETSVKFNILGKQKTDANWNVVSSLLSEFIYSKDEEKYIFYAFSNSIKDIIIRPTLYGMLNLDIQTKIDSRYTIALWEYLKGEICIAGKSKNSKLTEYVTVNDYCELIAGTVYQERQFKEINRQLIKAPIKELNKKTDLQAEVQFKKLGNKVTNLRFKIEQNAENVQQDLFLSKKEKSPSSLEEIEMTEKVYKINRVNELLIFYKVSEKKRQEFLKKYDPDYIEANIKHIARIKEYDEKQNKAPLIIKAIEDNYANFGPELEAMTRKSRVMYSLKRILNPIEKNDRLFLRNQIKDLHIYKERGDVDGAKEAAKRLLANVNHLNDLQNELIQIGYPFEEALKEIGYEDESEIWNTMFITKEDFAKLQNDIRIGMENSQI